MIFKRKNKFVSQISHSSLAGTVNPSRGWYSIFPFRLPQRPDFTELGYCLRAQESLVLVRICIGGYLTQPLDEQALSVTAQILDFFAANDKEMIVRIIYDEEGNGLMNEPACIEQIKVHMRQLGPVLAAHAKDILTLQGNFTGSWGEMHDSRYLNPMDMTQLFLCLYQATNGTCRMAVRKPSQRRTLKLLLGESGLPEAEKLLALVGIYNDGMMASETDYGTYSSAAADMNGMEDYGREWHRDLELDYQNKECCCILNGGETVCDNPYNDGASAVRILNQTHVSYLNSQHDPAVLEKWKTQTISAPQGEESAYSYISRHMGYCIQLSGADLNKKNPAVLQIRLCNIGFASLYEEAALSAVLTEQSAQPEAETEEGLELLECSLVYKLKADCSVPQIAAGQTAEFAVPLETVEPGIYSVSCTLRRVRDGKTIALDNSNAAGILTVV